MSSKKERGEKKRKKSALSARYYLLQKTGIPVVDVSKQSGQRDILASFRTSSSKSLSILLSQNSDILKGSVPVSNLLDAARPLPPPFREICHVKSGLNRTGFSFDRKVA